MLNYIKAYYTTFKAGWIASRCKTGCIIDNETEMITPCIFHKAEIVKLGYYSVVYYDKSRRPKKFF